MTKILPLYGHGLGRNIPTRNPTGDLFGGAKVEEEATSHAQRCKAIVEYLNGERSTPELTYIERTYGSDLGADDFDRRIEAMG